MSFKFAVSGVTNEVLVGALKQIAQQGVNVNQLAVISGNVAAYSIMGHGVGAHVYGPNPSGVVNIEIESKPWYIPAEAIRDQIIGGLVKFKGDIAKSPAGLAVAEIKNGEGPPPPAPAPPAPAPPAPPAPPDPPAPPEPEPESHSI